MPEWKTKEEAISRGEKYARSSCWFLYQRRPLGIKGSNSHPGTLSSEELQGTVYMSPQHMKAFAGMLLDHLHQYEAVFGPINLKPNDSALRAIAEAAPTTER